jgi:hypothetical protein
MHVVGFYYKETEILLMVAVKIIVLWRAMLRTSADRPTVCYETSVSIYQSKRRLISKDISQYSLRLSENRVQSGILRGRSNKVVVRGLEL